MHEMHPGVQVSARSHFLLSIWFLVTLNSFEHVVKLVSCFSWYFSLVQYLGLHLHMHIICSPSIVCLQ
jgi:hypothetical protein